MYTPTPFAETRADVLHDVIRRIGFGTLVTQGEEGPDASHLPLLLEVADGSLGTLSGHFARQNPQWLQARGPAQALFLGPHAYISPNWYASKQEHGKVVPTWNYIAIHATGTLHFYDDAAWLRDHLKKLTASQEAHRAQPWLLEDAPDRYIEGMMRAVVGFSLVITRLEGKWKLGQNRSAADRAGMRDGLLADGKAEMAALIPQGL